MRPQTLAHCETMQRMRCFRSGRRHPLVQERNSGYGDHKGHRPLTQGREVAQFYRAFTYSSPDELTTLLGFLTTPDGQLAVAFVVSYSGPLAQGEEVLRPLADMVAPMPYMAVQALFDPAYPPGRLNYWKSRFLEDLSDAAIETLIAQFSAVPSPLSVAALEQLGGAVSRLVLARISPPLGPFWPPRRCYAAASRW
jgi:hypothetical protein